MTKLTLAVGNYEITRALVDGTVEIDGVRTTVVTGLASSERHRRFFKGDEFDAAEVSLSSYLVAHDKGVPIRALPVFPLRRFRHGYVFINTTKGIRAPIDLNGKTIGVSSFQETGPLWMRGILEQHYGVSIRSIAWLSQAQPNVPQGVADGLRVSSLPEGTDAGRMLAAGEIDAFIGSNPIAPFIEGDARVARLFPNYQAEEISFYEKTGLFPIMHVIAVRQHILDQRPDLARALQLAFEHAKELARASDPRIPMLAWHSAAWEHQRLILGPDPWAYGLTTTNRDNLDTLISYAHDQGLISRVITSDDLFGIAA